MSKLYAEVDFLFKEADGPPTVDWDATMANFEVALHKYCRDTPCRIHQDSGKTFLREKSDD